MTSESREATNADTSTTAQAFTPVGSTDPEASPKISKMAPDLGKDDLPLPLPIKPFWEQVIVDVEYENVASEQRHNIRGCLELIDFYNIIDNRCKDRGETELFIDMLHNLAFEDLFDFVGNQDVMRDPTATFDGWRISRRGTRIILVHGSSRVTLNHRKAEKQIKTFVNALPDHTTQFKMLVFSPLLKTTLGRVIDESTGRAIGSPIFPTRDATYTMAYGPRGSYSPPVELPTISENNELKPASSSSPLLRPFATRKIQVSTVLPDEAAADESHRSTGTVSSVDYIADLLGLEPVPSASAAAPVTAPAPAVAAAPVAAVAPVPVPAPAGDPVVAASPVPAPVLSSAPAPGPAPTSSAPALVPGATARHPAFQNVLYTAQGFQTATSAFTNAPPSTPVGSSVPPDAPRRTIIGGILTRDARTPGDDSGGPPENNGNIRGYGYATFNPDYSVNESGGSNPAAGYHFINIPHSVDPPDRYSTYIFIPEGVVYVMRTAWNPGNTNKLILPSFYAENNGDNWYESVVQYFLAHGIFVPPFATLRVNEIMGSYWETLMARLPGVVAHRPQWAAAIYTLLMSALDDEPSRIVHPIPGPAKVREILMESCGDGYLALHKIMQYHAAQLNNVVTTRITKTNIPAFGNCRSLEEYTGRFRQHCRQRFYTSGQLYFAPEFQLLYLRQLPPVLTRVYRNLYWDASYNDWPDSRWTIEHIPRPLLFSHIVESIEDACKVNDVDPRQEIASFRQPRGRGTAQVNTTTGADPTDSTATPSGMEDDSALGVVNMVLEDGQVHAMMVSGPDSPCLHCGKTWVHKLGDCPGLVRALAAIHLSKRYPEVDAHVLQKYDGSTKILSDNRVVPPARDNRVALPPRGSGPPSRGSEQNRSKPSGPARVHAATSLDDSAPTAESPDVQNSDGHCEMLSAGLFADAYAGYFSSDVCDLGAISVPDLHGHDLVDEFPVDPPVPSLVPEVLPYLEYLDSAPSDDDSVALVHHAGAHTTTPWFSPVDRSRFLHVDHGANVSVVMNCGLLYQFRTIRPSCCPVLYDVGGNGYKCTGYGFLRVYSDSLRADVFVPAYYSPTIRTNILSPRHTIDFLGNGFSNTGMDHRSNVGILTLSQLPGLADLTLSGRLHVGLLWIGPLAIPGPNAALGTLVQPWGSTVRGHPRWPKSADGSYAPLPRNALEMGAVGEHHDVPVRSDRSVRRKIAQDLAHVLSLLHDSPEVPTGLGADCLELPTIVDTLDISDRCAPLSTPAPLIHTVQTRSARSQPSVPDAPAPDAPTPTPADVPPPPGVVAPPPYHVSAKPSDLDPLPTSPLDYDPGYDPNDSVAAHDTARRRLLRTLYHQRLGHLGYRRLSTLHKYVDGVPAGLSGDDPIGACPVCLANKMQRSPTRASSPFVATQPFEGLSMDFGFVVQRPDRSKMGDSTQLFSTALREPPDRILSPDEFRRLEPAQKYEYQLGLNGETGYLIIRDHYSGAVYGTAVVSKAPPLDFLRAFLERHRCTSSVKIVRLDQGGDLGGSRRLRELLSSFGYQIQLTAPDTPQQNGFIERINQDVGSYLRTALGGADLPPRFWPFAFHLFLRLYNYLPHDRGESVPIELRSQTPYEILTGKRPDLSQLRTFGCRVWVLPPGGRTRKGIHNTRSGRFLGYKITTQNILYLDEVTQEIREAHHVKFDEAFNDVEHPPPNAVSLRTAGLSNAGGLPATPAPVLSPHELDTMTNPSLGPVTISVTPSCTHETLGLILAQDDKRDRAFIRSVAANSSFSRIRGGSKRILGAFVLRIDGRYVQHQSEVKSALKQLATRQPRAAFDIVLDPDPYVPPSQVPQSPTHLSYDQMASIHAIRTARSNDDLDKAIHAFGAFFDEACMDGLVHSLGTVTLGTAAERALPRLTRNRLRRLETWEDWQRGPKGEFAQLDEMQKQGMYGEPVVPPEGAIVLRPHWTYSFKSDDTRKARNCCDGSKRAAPMLHGAAKTYASCVEQPCMRLYFALCAVSGMSIYGADATNAFANSPPPSVPTFVMIDDAYWDWYKERYDKELDRRLVLPVRHALQGHPESGSLWEQLINELLLQLGLQNTTHERNLYHGSIDGDRVLICRQVDDLAIGCTNSKTYDYILEYLMNHVTLTKDGLLSRFNGVDIDQTAHYVRVHCSSYIDRFLAAHGWEMPETDSQKPFEPLAGASLEELQTTTGPREGTAEHLALQEKFRFSYRGVLGEMIYVFVVARLDIGFAIVHLSKYSSMPAAVHYTALIRVAKYLRQTKDWGLVYWRRNPVHSFPAGSFIPFVDPATRDLPAFPPYLDGEQLVAFADAAHGTDLLQRRSVSGICCVLGGAAVVFKTKQQDVIATSSTEAEFVCAVHTGKIVKYLRSILHELGFTQLSPTMIFEDNRAAIAMVNSTKPTTRSRHIDIQHFAIQEWKRRGIVVLEHLQGVLSPADALTKPLGWMLHYRHCRRMMGHYSPPAYCTFEYAPCLS
jgi:transposase InsO family protein